MKELLVIFILLLINGFLAMSEIAFISSKKIRLQERAKKGNKSAQLALHLLEKPERFLSAIQVGITLVGILAGAYGGYAMAEDLTPLLNQHFNLGSYAEEVSIGIIVTIITFLSLIIGELVPKSIALNNSEAITISVATVMYYITKIFSPFVWLLSKSTNLLLIVLRVQKRKEPPITEEELKSLAELGTLHGTIEKEESEMIKKVFGFHDRRVNSIMIPRSEIEWIDLSLSNEEIFEFVSSHKYSRYPVCKDTIENCAGILEVKDFLLNYHRNSQFDLKKILNEVLIVPEKIYTVDLLEKFRAMKTNIALVVDEYGGTEGLVTLHDLIENIFGELPEKFEEREQVIIQREDGSFLVEGFTDVEKIEENFGIEIMKEGFSTVGGFVMKELGRVPNEGDLFVYRGYRFEVVDMDDKRVDKVLISKIAN